MSDDEVTRMIENPSVLLEGARLPLDDSRTPCVGVASIGQTHFGEAEVEDGSTTVPAVRRAKLSERWRRTALRISRPVALAIGVACGLLGALPIVLGSAPPKKQSTPSIEVLVRIIDSAGEPLEGIAVQWGSVVSISDGDGNALLKSTENHSQQITAKCPEGYLGGLFRRAPAASGSGRTVVRDSTPWSMKLVCEPMFHETLLSFAVSGCEEAEIELGGTKLGHTSGGRLEVLRRHAGEELLEVSARSLDERCEFEGPETVLLSPAETEQSLSWSGSITPRMSPRRRRSEPQRPYRL